MTSTKKIVDKFTHLNVSRQRKWQLRNPAKSKILYKRFKTSLKGLVNSREQARKRTNAGRRNLRIVWLL